MDLFSTEVFKAQKAPIRLPILSYFLHMLSEIRLFSSFCSLKETSVSFPQRWEPEQSSPETPHSLARCGESVRFPDVHLMPAQLTISI